ncbi:C-type lectin domain family 2 member B-like [Pelecanus crispus]|uniref:C-type lectin domain family 2 member B-like n=1 Tax=Pelecanus crispus TaxID=36300 RepID=UPI003F5D20E0
MSQYDDKSCGGNWPARHPVCAMVVVAVLVVLVVAFAMAVAVQSAGRHRGNPDLPAAGVLGCPEGWVGYHKVCYYCSNSTEEGSWEWSQEQCSSLGASLAVLKMGWEMEFNLCLKDNDDYWVGLWRRGERLEWVDGSSFNQTFPVHGQGPCVYLNKRNFGSSSCSHHCRYLCSKPKALGYQR